MPPTPASPGPTTRPTRPCWTPRCSASPCSPTPMTPPSAGPLCPPRYGMSGSSPRFSDRSWSASPALPQSRARQAGRRCRAHRRPRPGAGRAAPGAVPADQPAAAVARELDRLWLEPVFEPREPRDPAGRANALALERVFLVAAGEESARCARDYATQRGDRAAPRRPRRRAGTDLCRSGSRTTSGAGGRPRRHPPDGGHPDRGHAPPRTRRRLPPDGRVGELPAMLVGVARAVQNVQDEALLGGRDLPMHGLLITRGALPVPVTAKRPTWPRPPWSAPVGSYATSRRCLNWRLIDVDHASQLNTVVLESLVSGAYASDDADEVALRDDLRMVIVNQSSLSEPTGSSRKSTTAARSRRELRDRSAPVRSTGRPCPAGDRATCPRAWRD